jgi:hypothetical protein
MLHIADKAGLTRHPGTKPIVISPISSEIEAGHRSGAN